MKDKEIIQEMITYLEKQREDATKYLRDIYDYEIGLLRMKLNPEKYHPVN